PRMPLAKRLQFLAEGQKLPMASFDCDGRLMGASEPARSFLALLSGAEIARAHADAMARGHVELPIPEGIVIVQRVGSGTEVGLVALAMPRIVEKSPATGSQPGLIATPVSATPDSEHVVAPASELPLPAYEQPALTNEAPSEFALIDEFAEPLGNDGDAPSA